MDHRRHFLKQLLGTMAAAVVPAAIAPGMVQQTLDRLFQPGPKALPKPSFGPMPSPRWLAEELERYEHTAILEMQAIFTKILLNSQPFKEAEAGKARRVTVAVAEELKKVLKEVLREHAPQFEVKVVEPEGHSHDRIAVTIVEHRPVNLLDVHLII